jgi:trehalose synthase
LACLLYAFIAGFGIDTAKPLITQVSRFDIFKDPLGVVDAYKLAKRQIPDLQLAFVTKFADDDPEAQQIYQQILKYVSNDPDVHFIINPSNNYVVLNAFQTSSDIIIQKSIKEGFGLTVTEAMFKGRPVIGGNAGGIKLQIQDGINGFIVKSSAECSVKIVELLKSPNLAKTIGENARKSAQHFLIPTLALNYLEIFAKILLPSAKYNLYKEENIKSSLYAGNELPITADSE